MQTIEWQPFGSKHKEYIRKGLNSKMSVAEGELALYLTQKPVLPEREMKIKGGK